jgi:hypothetical protein
MQVLAITGNASLVVALGSMMRDWEVVTVRNADEAIEQGSPSMVALIDMGETKSGIEIADEMFRRGLGIPGVVIGDTAADHPRIGVLVRPFSLEDLSLAVRQASERPLASAVPTAGVDAHDAPGDEPVVTKADVQPAVASGATTTTVTAPAKPPEPKVPATLEVETAPKRPLSVVRPPKEEVSPGPGSVEQSPAAEEDPGPVMVEEPAAAQTVHEPAQPEPPIFEEPAFEEPPLHQEPTASQPAPAPAAAAPPAAPQEERRRGFRRKPSPSMRPAATVAAPEEPPLVRVLKVAARNLRDLELLLAELPFLEDARSMASALVAEVESLFDPQTVAIFVPGDNGWQPIAYSGLSRVEAGMVVPTTQPLFSDVISTKDGIMIQPVDLAQGLVAGIGGARTEAMMATPAVLDDQVIAIVVVGSERFDETDLDRLSDVAAEAAPGLAVALLLQEIRTRG